jgi:hypothetical protein
MPTLSPPERRKHPRQSMVTPIWATPLASNKRAIGPAIEMTSINMSEGGAALLLDRPCHAPWLMLDFGRSGVGGQLLLQVVRTERHGDFRIIAGHFADHDPTTPDKLRSTVAHWSSGVRSPSGCDRVVDSRSSANPPSTEQSSGSPADGGPTLPPAFGHSEVSRRILPEATARQTHRRTSG